MAIPTLTEIGKFSPNVRTELIDQATLSCPEFGILPWKAVPGYTYSTLRRTANPTAAFRAVNVGTAGTKSTYANTTITCKYLNPRWTADKAVADAHIDGREVFMGYEAQAHYNAAVLTASKQLWYGTDADAGGFAGLIASTDSTMVTNAGGTTEDVASSCFIVAGGQTDYLTWVLGGDGSFDVSEVRIGDVSDGTNDYTAYIQELGAYIGCQLGHAKAVARIRDLTTDTGKGLTDALIFATLAKFPLGVKPTAIICNQRSLEQLRASRTATNATGAPAPHVTEVSGIPVYASEAIISTEEVVSQEA
jgi:hypothetical protein